MLTDNDVAAVLARISGPASALTSKQVADALVHAVQLAHVSLEARNIYLDPKQSDRVVVFDQGWGYQQLTTAVPVNIEQLVFAISMAGAKSLCKVSIANKAVDVLREHQIIQQKMTTRLK